VCNTKAWCSKFFLGTGSKAGECDLYEDGCIIGADVDLSYYEKLSVPSSPIILEYDASSTRLIYEHSAFSFFRNEHTTLCGPINSCALKEAGCGSDYAGTNLALDATTGVGTSVQNIDIGFSDTVCV
jgi:hypothetical protein